MPGLLDCSCSLVLVKQCASSWRGGGERVCIACGEPTTVAKEIYLWSTAVYRITFREKSELTAVILTRNFNGANEAMVRMIPWLNQALMLNSLRRF